jgi:hypothetical protein
MSEYYLGDDLGVLKSRLKYKINIIAIITASPIKKYN